MFTSKAMAAKAAGIPSDAYVSSYDRLIFDGLPHAVAFAPIHSGRGAGPMVGLAMQVDGFPMQVLDETGKTYRIGAHDFTVHIHNSKADGYHNFRITFVDKDGIDQDMRVGFELKKQVPIARDRHVPADSAAMKNALTQIEQMDPNAGEAMLDDKPARARRHGRKQGPPTARGH